MSLITLLIVLIVFGVFLWWFNSLPVDPKVKWIINGVVVLVLLILVLAAFGVWDEVRAVKVPKL